MDDNKKSDNSTDSIILFCLFIAGLWALGYFFGDQIKTVYLTIKLYQLKFMGLFSSSEDLHWIINKIETKSISSWTWGEVVIVGNYVGNILNFAFVSICAYITYKIYKKNPYKMLTRRMDMDGLMASEKNVWPFLIPISHVNLLKEPLDTGKYAMAMKPVEFAFKYKLLDTPNDLTTLNKMKAEKIFANQLGKLWDGVDNLNDHCKAIFAIMAAQAAGDTFPCPFKTIDPKTKKVKIIKSIDYALEVVMDICKSTEGGKKPNLESEKILFLINRYKNDEKIIKIMNRHAYNYTAFGSLYIEACKNGVLPPNYFNWLRTINRKLYYFLNATGRRVSWVEVAGIYGHWKAEIISRKPLEKPYVINARVGLDRALQEMKLVEEY